MLDTYAVTDVDTLMIHAIIHAAYLFAILHMPRFRRHAKIFSIFYDIEAMPRAFSRRWQAVARTIC